MSRGAGGPVLIDEWSGWNPRVFLEISIAGPFASSVACTGRRARLGCPSSLWPSRARPTARAARVRTLPVEVPESRRKLPRVVHGRKGPRHHGLLSAIARSSACDTTGYERALPRDTTVLPRLSTPQSRAGLHVPGTHLERPPFCTTSAQPRPFRFARCVCLRAATSHSATAREANPSLLRKALKVDLASLPWAAGTDTLRQPRHACCCRALRTEPRAHGAGFSLRGPAEVRGAGRVQAATATARSLTKRRASRHVPVPA
jgi:hypothetical protein